LSGTRVRPSLLAWLRSLRYRSPFFPGPEVCLLGSKSFPDPQSHGPLEPRRDPDPLKGPLAAGVTGNGDAIGQLAYLGVGDEHEPARFFVVIAGGRGGLGAFGEADSGQLVAADLLSAGGGVHGAGDDPAGDPAARDAAVRHGDVQQLGCLVGCGLGRHLR
jgi:hypothetical protein